MAQAPTFDKTTTLVSRALGMTPAALRSGFVPARREHLPRILAIRSAILGDRITWDDERYLSWRYDLDGRDDARGTVFVVTREGEVLGLVGAERLQLTVGVERVPCLLIMDIAVDPAIDGSGVGIWMDLALFAAHPVVLAIGANPNSIGLVTRLFERLPDRKHLATAASLTRLMQRKLGARLGWALAQPVNVVLRAWRTATTHPIAGVGLREIERFDGAVDALFTRRAAPSEVTPVRTAASLNWRLFENPRARYRVIGAWSNGALLGYIAFQRSERDDTLREVSIVDWLVDARYEESGLELLVHEVLRIAAAESVDVVHLTQLHARSEATMRRLGFLPQRRTYNVVGLHVNAAGRWPRLHDGGAWRLTEASTDRDGLL